MIIFILMSITIIILCSFLATEDLFAGDNKDLEMCDAWVQGILLGE